MHVKPEPALLTFISTWESIALTTGKIPTWTALVHRLPRSARLTLVAAVSVYLTVHFHCVALSRDV